MNLKAHIFQSGFVAQRIARGLRDREPEAVIEVIPLKGEGRPKELPDGSFIWADPHLGFVIQKTEAEVTTVWVSHNDGWMAPDA
jgi:hypothetical protein